MASSAAQVVLPLALLLPLLVLFKQNRCVAAWAIWVPVALTAVLAAAVVIAALNSEQDILHGLCAYCVGWAAVWLLSPYLKSRHQFLVFLKTFAVLSVFGVLAFCPRFLGGSAGWIDLRPFMAIALGVASLPGALALVLAGRCVRRGFGRLRYLLWVAVWLFAIWNVCSLPFVLLSSGKPDWADYFRGILIIWGLTLGLMLPLLVFSFFNGFYRDRLVSFLNLSLESRGVSQTSLAADHLDRQVV